MTIKDFTDNSIYGTDLDINGRLLQSKAAQEHLDQLTKVLEKDNQLLIDIYKALNIKNPNEIWENVPSNNVNADIVTLHKSYLNLLARCVQKSSSSDFSEGLRSRFGISGFIVNPDTANLSNVNASLLRSKFINLWSLHGVIRRPNILQRLIYRFISIFNKQENKDQNVQVS